MALQKSLSDLCVDFLYNRGKTSIEHIRAKGGTVNKGKVLNYLISILKLFKVADFIDRKQNHDIIWVVRTQDLNNNSDYVALTLFLQSGDEARRFKAFLRHLLCNWFRGIKVRKLDTGNLSFVVTYPAKVLLCFYAEERQDCVEQPTFSTAKSSDVQEVSEVVWNLLQDFGLASKLNAPEKLSSAVSKKNEAEVTTRNENLEYDSRTDIFPAELYRAWSAPSDLLEELEKAYHSLTNSDQTPAPPESEEGTLMPHSSRTLPTRVKSEVGKRSQTEVGYEKLVAENMQLRKMVESIEAQRMALQERMDGMIAKHESIVAKESEMRELLHELGRVSVELTRLQREKKRDELFSKTYKSHTASTQTATTASEEIQGAGVEPSASGTASTSGAANETEADRLQRDHDVRFQISIQESLEEAETLSSMATTGVEGTIHNNYKLLFLRISEGLLHDDVAELKEWARQYEIDTSADVFTILLELDRKKVISTTNLGRLTEFFEKILRYDFVCIVESFLLGDYGQLKISNPSKKPGSFNRVSSARSGLTDLQRMTFQSSAGPNASLIRRTSGTFRGAPDTSRGPTSVLQRKLPESSRPSLAETESGSTSSGLPPDRPRSARHTIKRPVSHTPTDSDSPATGDVRTVQERNVGSGTSRSSVVVDGRSSERAQASAGNTSARGDSANTSRNTDLGSNGQKLSKPQRPDSATSASTQGRGNRARDDDVDSNWLCTHYKRRCYVQFECCNRFWPCHRCHNNQSTCGRRKLKSRDTKQIKCVACGQVQQFTQFCTRCNAKFAKYFCGLCKHLTGTDDSPYHCEKCGICRIHGDRSFHCDVCGVCLDVQLRGNHKCREGSAHDECCICLEDAFTGCQILPCSHKVHKECATQMIRSGITRCPICRESFAHKLERRPPPSKKPPGKQ